MISWKKRLKYLFKEVPLEEKEVPINLEQGVVVFSYDDGSCFKQPVTGRWEGIPIHGAGTLWCAETLDQVVRTICLDMLQNRMIVFSDGVFNSSIQFKQAKIVERKPYYIYNPEVPAKFRRKISEDRTTYEGGVDETNQKET